MSRGVRIKAADYDAILAALNPTVHDVMRRFSISASTAGKLAFRAGQQPQGGQG